jgi:hypothetical protein
MHTGELNNFAVEAVRREGECLFGIIITLRTSCFS